MKNISVAILFLLLFPALSLAASEPSGGKQQSAGKKANRLINSESPYLRQHAYNPVDWRLWGKEAFEEARKQNKPIFLSVGYSTCHWCHVMARESYNDKAVAEIINRYFIPIKVDRERRPDVDETYMIATELIARQGGWPNNVFMTPELKPFYGGTYFPKKDFTNVLNTIAEQWIVARPGINAEANRFGDLINKIMNRRFESQSITATALSNAVTSMMRSHDFNNGGFSLAPKFPQESLLMFLLHMAKQDQHEEAERAIRRTLLGILNGGIHDQVGGGFHRYAVDLRWRIPHFEKMLYNQAQMVRILIDAHELTGNRRYADAARRTLDSVARDMQAPEGVFYSAWDADSEGAEGTFYVWTMKDLEKALTKEETALAIKVFGLKSGGNFHGKNVLHMQGTLYDIADQLKLSEKALSTQLDAIRKKLLAYRASRPKPHRDNKIITEWNGMMISAYARAAAVLNDEKYKSSALKAADFFWSKMIRKDGSLNRIFFEGKAGIDGNLDDYAHLAVGLIDLYDLTGEQLWLDRAEKLAQKTIALFKDKEAGDFFRVAKSQTFTRGKSRSDGPVPSGNAVALEMFAKLARRSQNPDYRTHAEAITASISAIALRGPMTNAYALRAADMLQRGEPGAMTYLAKGVVKAKAVKDKDGKTLKVSLQIKPGWHINAHKPLEEFLIPTSLKLAGNKDKAASYPKPLLRKLGFHDKELALYEGDVELSIKYDQATEQKNLKAELHLQACSDQICLDPETVTLQIYN